MTKTRAVWTVAMAVFAYPGVLSGHHSLAQFDTSVPVWVKGTVVSFERVNPHSVIFIDQESEDGQVHRWAVDGPAPRQFARMGIDMDILKAGDVIEICGFATRAGARSQREFQEPLSLSLRSSTPNSSGQVMNGHLLVLPDGEKRV